MAIFDHNPARLGIFQTADWTHNIRYRVTGGARDFLIGTLYARVWKRQVSGMITTSFQLDNLGASPNNWNTVTSFIYGGSAVDAYTSYTFTPTNYDLINEKVGVEYMVGIDVGNIDIGSTVTIDAYSDPANPTSNNTWLETGHFSTDYYLSPQS